MKQKLFILVLALQTAWILGTTVVQERALVQGKRILLETRPVDPRDLLRGDYVILNYTISDVPWTSLTPAPEQPLKAGQAIYVALEQRGAFHEIVRAATEPFAISPSQVLLKGRVEPWTDGIKGSPVRVTYGLERYYVREGTGNPQGKLTVEATVSRAGQALIKQVFLDGRPYAEAMANPNNPR